MNTSTIMKGNVGWTAGFVLSFADEKAFIEAQMKTAVYENLPDDQRKRDLRYVYREARKLVPKEKPKAKSK